MKLTNIESITGKLELVTGLHIGAGDSEMHIGGTDNPVIKNPVNNEPYIPGSSIKGKLRSLCEWTAGVVADTNGKPLGFDDLKNISAEQRQDAINILRLFGGAAGLGDDKDVLEVGPTRVSFWDCNLDRDWVKMIDDRGLMRTEVKMENSIDRIKGMATNPRNTERVPAGAVFDFRLTLRVHDDEDITEVLLQSLRLLELSGLGGSGSRGYGKLKFTRLEKNGDDLLPVLASTNPFKKVA